MIVSNITSTELVQRIFPLKCLLLDVEGILTLQHRSLKLPFSTDLFSHDDREGIRELISKGFIVGVISSGESKLLRKILQELHVPFIYLGTRDKVAAYEEIKKALELEDKNFAHMGDGSLDALLFAKVGFSISVPNAPAEIRAQATYCTTAEGGWGAVAEIAKLILHYQRGYH